MHARVYREFERICSAQRISGRVLEIGATPEHRSLLEMTSLSGATERVGINVSGPYTCRGYDIVEGNANDMYMFGDQSFDAVLCNAVLEHDKYFWRTLAEIRRVTKPGGLIVIGAPSYSEWRWATYLRKVLRKMPLIYRMAHSLVSSTLTLNVHDAPADYYRFSPNAFREILLEGLEGVHVRTVMVAPRTIGWGRKPGGKREDVG